MKNCFQWIKVLGLALWCFQAAYAAQGLEAYHDYWLPTYHQQRLSFCLSDKHSCGAVVADTYCQKLGYSKAKKFKIAHNVGMTSYIDKKACCRGWHCQGFNLIRCERTMYHEPKRQYYYRYKKFVFPRWQHYRIDWCYQDNHACGKRAAYSFCRRMGYETATQYQAETHLGATRALGNHQLCFGDCKGFANITCFR
jgi:hypothetical protein